MTGLPPLKILSSAFSPTSETDLRRYEYFTIRERYRVNDILVFANVLFPQENIFTGWLLSRLLKGKMLLISMFLETPSPSPTWAREDGHSGLAPDRVDDSLTFHPEDPSLEVSPPDPDGEAQCGAGETVWNGMVRLCVVWCVISLDLTSSSLSVLDSVGAVIL